MQDFAKSVEVELLRGKNFRNLITFKFPNGKLKNQLIERIYYLL
jgi:hypothetical protein